jgi:tetratricopeptide (TPR) repeat protein
MNLILRSAALAAVLAAGLSAQEIKKPDDILQKRDGGILVGRILKLDGDWIEFFANGEKEPRKVSTKDLMPYSVYRMRLERVDKKNGQARYDLGDYCMTHGLYAIAAREFAEAGTLDKALEEKSKKKAEEAHHEDGRSKYEEAKRLSQLRQYAQAQELVRLLIDKYSDTPFAKEAKDLDAKMAEEIAKENEIKKKQLEEALKAKEDQKVQQAVNQEKSMASAVVEEIDRAQKAWAEGLDHEPKNLTKADRAWRAAEISLVRAKALIGELLKSNDVETIKKAKDLDRQTDVLLVRTYYRLGRMWAVELSYTTALEWLNKGLRVPHDEQMDHLLNELILHISTVKIRERAAGRGY